MTDRGAGFIGVLSLDTQFPRILGDAGHPDSYHLPARIRVVKGAGSVDIVQAGRPSAGMVADFVAGAKDLEAEGASLITSTCGFLISVQSDIAAAVRTPVVLSGLSLAPLIRAMTGGRPIGVLTASSAALTNVALLAAGVGPGDVVVQGLEDRPLFAQTFLADKSRQARVFEPQLMQAEVLKAAQRLVASAPRIGSILLECGNLPPYAKALRAATGLPVFSILDAARMVASDL